MAARALWIPGGLLVACGLALGLLWSQETGTAPARTTVEVTYYYLPG